MHEITDNRFASLLKKKERSLSKLHWAENSLHNRNTDRILIIEAIAQTKVLATQFRN